MIDVLAYDENPAATLGDSKELGVQYINVADVLQVLQCIHDRLHVSPVVRRE